MSTVLGPNQNIDHNDNNNYKKSKSNGNSKIKNNSDCFYIDNQSTPSISTWTFRGEASSCGVPVWEGGGSEGF